MLESDSEDELERVGWRNPIAETLLMGVDGPAMGNINTLAKASTAQARTMPQPPSPPAESPEECPALNASADENGGRSRASRDGEPETGNNRRRHASEPGRSGRGRRRRTSVPHTTRRQTDVAPGEGNRPVPSFMDSRMEELAYPALFPTGEGCAETQRLKEVGLSEYLKNRLTLVDRRFIGCPPWIFSVLYKRQFKTLMDSISVSLRKATVSNDFNERVNEVHFACKCYNID